MDLNGSLAGNEEIEDMALRLEPPNLDIEDKNLLQLTNDWSEIAKDVIKIVRTLKLEGSYYRRQTLKKSFKTLRRKSDVNKFRRGWIGTERP
ncbi:hypothetical protein N7G274_005481 [Stereocaulon virgatum]|uniref:Uncharacterized protein n=1 Tax=Stereocaulon virgatum TaxID=373712 RepID=A0ABR4A6Z8_9LECA